MDCREECIVSSVWVECSVNTCSASDLWGNLTLKVSCLSFIHMIPISESGVLKSSTTTTLWLIYGFRYNIIPFTKLGTPVFGIYFGGDMLFCLLSASSGINISGINLLTQFFFHFCFSHFSSFWRCLQCSGGGCFIAALGYHFFFRLVLNT